MSRTDTGPLTVRPVTGLTGAEIIGLDRAQPVTTEAAGQIRRALTEHAVVFIRDQGVDPNRHLEIARALGPTKDVTFAIDDNLSAEGFPEIGVIHSQGQGTARWHTDLAWSPAPVKYTVLHMQQAPAAGGDTCWANQYAAFEALSPSMQTMLLPLTACNQRPGNPEHHTHPVVISNPETGRRALFVTPAFTARIHELNPDESDAILAMLSAHSTKPEFICRWTYEVGDIAVWDNHYVMHYAVNDYSEVGRKIHRIEIDGDGPTLIGAPRPSDQSV